MLWTDAACVTFAFLLAFAGGAQPAQAATYELLYAFPRASRGFGPSASLIAVGSRLYGTTPSGGAFGFGTVFSVNPATGAEKVVYSFQSGSDGASPNASLVNVGGTLYGTTIGGGTMGSGTVFSVSPKTGAEAVIYSFKGGDDGLAPYASLINVGNKLYGTTEYGGSSTICYNRCGTVFSVNRATGIEKVVYSFRGAPDGFLPAAGLLDFGGVLYGTTVGGGNSVNCFDGCGTAFAVHPATGVEKIVYSFRGGTDGAKPEAALIDVGGTLYGTTASGGASYVSGAVFSLDPTTGDEQVVYSFLGGHDGYDPQDSLIDVQGTLYGTTSMGGPSNLGTVFSLNLPTGAEKIEYSFMGGSDGAKPNAGLINVGSTLYGVTPFGGSESCGSQGCGSVFAFTP